MFKKLLIGIIVIVLVYTLLPMNVIDFMGKFAIGWVIMDIVDKFVED
jgi:hypothetical protein